MVAKLAAVTLKEGGETFFVEITETTGGSAQGLWDEAAVDSDIKIDTVSESLARLINGIRPLALKTVDGFKGDKDLPKPETISMSMGVKLSGEVGFFVARSTGEASIDLTISWRLNTDKPE